MAVSVLSSIGAVLNAYGASGDTIGTVRYDFVFTDIVNDTTVVLSGVRPARAGRAMSDPLTRPITSIRPGCPYPLGATWDGEGVNFAIFSEHAERVELGT